MSAPCGKQTIDLFREMRDRDMLIDPEAVQAYFKDKKFLGPIKHALEQFNEDIHLDWSEYRRQIARQLDERFGTEWRTLGKPKT